jgi:putative transposase
MIDYLHNNPIRRGLIEQTRNWKWSSAAWYEGGSTPLLIDPLPAEWLDDT